MLFKNILMKLDYAEKYLGTFSHIQYFESVFAEDDFDILSDHYMLWQLLVKTINKPLK